jgi:hypothetical protein
MFRALGQLLLRGGVSLAICAVAALAISGFLSLIATHLQPKAVAGSIANTANIEKPSPVTSRWVHRMR